MKYAIIAPGGELTHHDGELDWDSVIGPEGWARVRLHPSLAVTGFVNDVGHLFPEKYPRNVVGSCVLLALGAHAQPYAGPVVMTGWDPRNTELGRVEIVPLPNPEFLTELHRDIQAALDGRPVTGQHPLWADAIRETAEMVRTADTPTITFHPGSPW